MEKRFMSEEEKEAIDILRGFEPDDLVECSIYLQELEKITKLIDKQQKEIEELKEIRRKVTEIIVDENDNLEKMFIKLIRLFKIPRENVETNCVSKDKIRAKIKEIEGKGSFDAKIVLEKLLEE